MEFKDFISIGALILAGISFYFARKYARTNVLHSIQKLVLEKSKDCNMLYLSEYDKWREGNKYRSLDMDMTPYDFIPTINEIVISVQLMDTTLEQFKHLELTDFFLKQFWIQLSQPIRYYIKTYDRSKVIIKSDEVNNTILIRNTFQHLFDKY